MSTMQRLLLFHTPTDKRETQPGQRDVAGNAVVSYEASPPELQPRLHSRLRSGGAGRVEHYPGDAAES